MEGRGRKAGIGWGTMAALGLLSVFLVAATTDCHGKLGSGAVDDARDSRKLGGRFPAEFVLDTEGDDRYVNVTGDTMTGDLSMSFANLGIGVPTPNARLQVQQGPTALTTVAAGGMFAGDTTATVGDTTGYPATGIIVIDFEAMNYTGTTATTFTGLTRGALGTAAAAHAFGASVNLITSIVQSSSTTPRLVTTANGNVGIGTTSPNAPLDVFSTSGMRIGGSTAKHIAMFTAGAGNDIGTVGGDLFIEFDRSNAVDLLNGFMRITTGGNVGIGTAGPGRKVVVDVGSAQDGIDIFGTGNCEFRLGPPGIAHFANMIWIAADLSLRMGTSQSFDTLNIQNGRVGIGTTGPDANARVTILAPSGNATLPASLATALVLGSTDGTIGASSIRARGTITGGLADIGEYIPFEGEPAEYEQGDLLACSTTSVQRVRKSSRAYQEDLIGLVTTTAGLLAGGGDETITYDAKGNPTNRVIIALAGRVPVKVSQENGPIAVGDYLTSSSMPGVAMKATRTGRVIGIALEAFQGPNPEPRTSYPEQKILCFVNPHTWVSPEEFQELKQRLERLEEALLARQR